MGKNKVIPVVLSVFSTVIISFFVFAFVDFNASSPGGGTPVEKENNESNEDTSESGTTEKGTDPTQNENEGSDNQSKEQTKSNTNISNDVQNNVNGQNTDVSNDVQNNVNGDNAGNADINNSIDNNLNNSNNNQIENNVTNNINVSVNVNVSNDVNNNTNGQSSDSKKNKEGSNKNNGKEGNSGENNNGNQNGEGESNQDRLLWGVDSANLTTEEMLACVGNNFGSPDIWGRYLGGKEGVSAGLTPEEVERLHSNDIKILVIWNHFTNATGYENGKNEANEAIQMAKDFGIPEGVALFADIEPSYPVDDEFIRGWFETINQSEYESGIYGVFDAEQELYKAYVQAGQNNEELLQKNYVWTASPNIGITTEAQAPEYKPEAPKNSLIGGWQYGLEAQPCNIDTNLFHSDLLDVLW